MEDNNNNAIVVQRDATTCAPLVGKPKSLISKGGKNVLDYNQEPPPEFVSDKNRLDCFAFARNDAMVEFEDNECNKILLIDLKKILRLKPQNDALRQFYWLVHPTFLLAWPQNNGY